MSKPLAGQNIDIAISNYALYEDATEFIGVGDITMPNINNMTAEVRGAGIAGAITELIMGYLEAMEVGVAFRLFSGNAIRLLEPRDHLIELRVVQQERDPVNREYLQRGLKHTMIVFPKTTNPGSVRTAAPGDASGTYGLRYWKMELDGKIVFEFDPIAFIYIVNGYDYLAETRRLLGK